MSRPALSPPNDGRFRIFRDAGLRCPKRFGFNTYYIPLCRSPQSDTRVSVCWKYSVTDLPQLQRNTNMAASPWYSESIKSSRSGPCSQSVVYAFSSIPISKTSRDNLPPHRYGKLLGSPEIDLIRSTVLCPDHFAVVRNRLPGLLR